MADGRNPVKGEVWRGMIYPLDTYEVLHVLNDQVAYIHHYPDGNSKLCITTVQAFVRTLHPPKEVWEDPQPIDAFVPVHRDGQLEVCYTSPDKDYMENFVRFSSTHPGYVAVKVTPVGDVIPSPPFKRMS